MARAVSQLRVESFFQIEKAIDLGLAIVCKRRRIEHPFVELLLSCKSAQ